MFSPGVCVRIAMLRPLLLGGGGCCNEVCARGEGVERAPPSRPPARPSAARDSKRARCIATTSSRVTSIPALRPAPATIRVEPPPSRRA
ncbi:hypothetical protein T484DRAFT_1928758 [Baffinella frigidus]|nr:hypothetical protein T484DRAFT_1928758 [Cryptophyta sp. CCMP2293]